MRSDLDELLDSSAPPLMRRTPELTSELHRLVADAEAVVVSAKRRTRRRVAVAGIAVTSVLGIGAGASAGGLIDLIPEPQSGDWLSGEGTVEHEFTLASGEKCEVTYVIEPSAVEGLARLRSGMNADDWSAALHDAQVYMDGVDGDGIDLTNAVANFERADAGVRQQLSQNGLPASEMSPSLSRDQTQVLAFAAELLDRVQTHLRSEGYDPSVVTIASGNKCRGLM